MDCSNPVQDSTRISLKEMARTSLIRKRQDLGWLEAKAKASQRVAFGVLEVRERGSTGRGKELEELERAVRKEIASVPDLNLDFLKIGERIPVCGLMLNGIPIHPPGTNQEGGIVRVNRTFGGQARDKDLLAKALEYFTPEELKGPCTSTVYTRGTAKGFEKRLREQMTRKCVSLSRMHCAVSGIKGAWSSKKMQEMISTLFPVDLAKLPDLSRDLSDLLDEVVTSKISSAGAPYWKVKPEAYEEMTMVILPEVVDAIAKGELKTLYEQNPELFIVEVKNKLDRYDPEKLDDKCRPYVSLPFHFQNLFSILSQGFTQAMKLYHEVPKCANAYGMSWAHGGGEKLRRWARDLKPGKAKFCCYGDDADVYYRRKNGNLVRITPDFRQMDGSVDLDTVIQTIQYILDCYAKAQPALDMSFWKALAGIWVEYATDPIFMVHGTGTYRKQQKDGLMTGVVGTTLFDTVKGAAAYHMWQTMVERDPSFLEADRAIPLFRKMGLEIKAGTWNVELVNEEPAPGDLWTTQKFLGMALQAVEGPRKIELAPYLTDEEWLSLIMVPRTDPNPKLKLSHTAADRLKFDRARGYLVTGAFSSERVSQFLYSQIDTVGAAAILMIVQENGGLGASPEVPNVSSSVHEEFVWPSSGGVPSRMWCRNLYLSDDNKFPPEIATWDDVFPGIMEEINEFKRVWKLKTPQVVQTARRTEWGSDDRHTLLLDAEPAERSALELGPAPLVSAPPKLPRGEHNKRSKIVDVREKGGVVEKEPRKYIPNLSMVLEQMFETVSIPHEEIAKYHSMPKIANLAEIEEQALADLARGRPVPYLPMLFASVLKDLKEGESIEFTAVMPLPLVAFKLGRSMDECANECIKRGYIVAEREGSGMPFVYKGVPGFPDAYDQHKVERQIQHLQESAHSPVIALGKRKADAQKAVKQAQGRMEEYPLSPSKREVRTKVTADLSSFWTAYEAAPPLPEAPYGTDIEGKQPKPAFLPLRVYGHEEGRRPRVEAETPYTPKRDPRGLLASVCSPEELPKRQDMDEREMVSYVSAVMDLQQLRFVYNFKVVSGLKGQSPFIKGDVVLKDLLQDLEEPFIRNLQVANSTAFKREAFATMLEFLWNEAPIDPTLHCELGAKKQLISQKQAFKWIDEVSRHHYLTLEDGVVKPGQDFDLLGLQLDHSGYLVRQSGGTYQTVTPKVTRTGKKKMEQFAKITGKRLVAVPLKQ